MAGLSEAERESLYLELGEAEQARWAELLPKIRRALDAFTKTGYMVNKGSLHEQINAVGVPVRSPDGSMLLALSAGGISQVFNDAKLKAIGLELKQLADRLAPALGAAI
jgi:DNA-binding IclR family transcriptional regulator